MFSHVTIGTHDLERAIRFYDAALGPLGIQRASNQYTSWAAWQQAGELQKFWVGLPYNGLPASWGNGCMVAFSAPSREAVEKAYAAAVAAGGRDEGQPGLRESYGSNYFGAYVRDPDGNKVHFVCRGPE